MARILRVVGAMSCAYCDAPLTISTVLARRTCPKCGKDFITPKPTDPQWRELACEASEEKQKKRLDPAPHIIEKYVIEEDGGSKYTKYKNRKLARLLERIGRK